MPNRRHTPSGQSCFPVQTRTHTCIKTRVPLLISTHDKVKIVDLCGDAPPFKRDHSDLILAIRLTTLASSCHVASFSN
ncbi:hypothetical protein FH972_012655 [Carpinus fangiana]|uniref:Uncharacterized protein n=1 Tax=Carpinus fangiana TaxID=176857 RepID=A0A5N6R7T8_9ROSI|nr:hypothetical protein FH972_012655 [Carpinus fangiana]